MHGSLCGTYDTLWWYVAHIIIMYMHSKKLAATENVILLASSTYTLSDNAQGRV